MVFDIVKAKEIKTQKLWIKVLQVPKMDPNFFIETKLENRYINRIWLLNISLKSF